MKKLLLFLVCLISMSQSKAQCLQLINAATDSVGWVYGSSRPSHPAHYNNDTFVVCNATGGENNFIYNSTPITLYGTTSTFSMSFDFRIDSNYSCSDGLTFWFFTSGLSQLGSRSYEGGRMGFPDTTIGFALAFRTIGCIDEIFMKKINSTSYNWCGGRGCGGDTDLCSNLSRQMFLTDSHWHQCVVTYTYGNITASFDGGAVVMTGYCPLFGTGHFGFMGTNGGGYSRKCIKNISTCGRIFGTPTIASDSFGVIVSQLCNGPQLTVVADSSSSTCYIRTWFGDGTKDSSSLLPAGRSGYCRITHNYATTGTFTIKQKLYRAGLEMDSLTFNYNNLSCTTIPVRYYYDQNSNCRYDSGSDALLSSPVIAEIDSNGIPIDTISATAGFYYTAHGSPGDIYAVRMLSSPTCLTVSCPASGVIFDTLTAGTHIADISYIGFGNDSGASFDLRATAVIPVTGVRDQWGNIFVENSYCRSVGGTLTLHYSSKYAGSPTQIYPSAAYSSVGTISWDLSRYSGSTSRPLQLHWEGEHGSTPLTIRDTVHTYFTVTPLSGDSDTTNNYFFQIDTVRAGCDPNNILVSPAGCFISGTEAHDLKYTINFENTGNDTAHNIYVLDTLPAQVDPMSLKLVMASHEMFVSKYPLAGGRTVMKFDFPSIKLLDSSHHGACDGALIYTIKTHSGLSLGTDIMNRAGIYFDVNEVVMTNEVHNTIGCPTTGLANGNQEAVNVSIYPNPTHDQLNIVVSHQQYESYSIANSIGTIIASGAIRDTHTQVNIQDFATGVYFVTLKGASGTIVKRLVKL